MHKNALKERPRRRRLPADTGEWVISTIDPMFWIGSSMRQFQTGRGSLILLPYGQLKAGSMWRQSLICSHGGLLVGR